MQNSTKEFGNNQQKQVGIDIYLSPGRQLQGITKFLITDFIVNEVNQDQTVVQFSTKPDPANAMKFVTSQAPEPKKQEQPDESKYAIDETKRQLLLTKFHQQTTVAIQSLYSRLEAKQKITNWSHSFKGPETREDRIELHEFIKTNLPNIQSRTDLGIIKLTYAKNNALKKFKKTNEYIYFKLFKTNIDTMSALFKLSKILGVNQKMFGIAGLKDKRGATTQMISLYNCEPDVFSKFYRVAQRTREIWIGQCEQHKKESLVIGGLYGNRFSLVIRFVEEREQIEKQLLNHLQNLKNRGFINYFGMQRFGKGKFRTHHVGCEILKKNWQRVVEELLLQDTGDARINQLKKDLYESGDFRKAQTQLPNKYQIEKNLFNGLVRNGRNYCTVFQSLPRSSRMIYGHALQSYIWNRVVSQRIQKYGSAVKVGDLVAKKTTKTVPKQAEENVQEDKALEKEEEVVQEAAELIEEIVQEDFMEVQLVNQHNIGEYSEFDIVVPLYGSKLILPENYLVKDLIETELQCLGLTFENFEKGLPKSLSLYGGYRKMLARAENVSWMFVNHKERNQQLQSPFYYLEEEHPSTQGHLFSLILRLTLQKSSYATMLLREVLKMPSSFDIQEQLNQKYKAR